MKTSKYVTVDSKRLHFHMLGNGPALVLFHPSPHTSEILLPLAKRLADFYTVFAIDTPGYGKSSPLSSEPNQLSDYTEFLHRCFKVMNIKNPSIYGSATGAQLAIRYALEYPKNVASIFLDNAAHFDDALCNTILDHYFPDFTPKKDGSHLPQVWKMVSQMFQYFPWCFRGEKYALHRPQLPPPVLNSIALDFLRAGANYYMAYRLAFKHERAKYVQALKVPTTIFRWNGSIIKEHINNLLAFDLPSNVKTLFINGTPDERMQLLTDCITGEADQYKSYKASRKIQAFKANAPIAYNKIIKDLPEIVSNGSHLITAWELLMERNPNLSAEMVQSCLIDSYS